ncbi:MAG: DUF4126 domain-containing protein, partial [Vicinamibacterales bacterium]
METVETLGRAMGFAFAAGLNLYASVAILGLASRFGWVQLPPQFDVFNHDWVIAAALVMYVIEFIADKVPWVDSLWDSVHTAIRPIGGALIAMTAIGDVSPALEGLAALMGGTLAAGTHLTKAGTRAVANTSPEPFSNWFLSLGEDLFVVGLGWLALQYPVAALVVVAILSATILIFISLIIRWARRRW